MNGNLTFNDVLNGSTFSEWFADQLSNFTPLNVVIALIVALAAGIVIALVYKKTYRGVLYSPSFTLTLILLCLVTTPVVMAIGSNVALSMGMVGALSIVRFRTAVKDPLDTAYMFWAITMGILVGSNAYVIAIVALLGIAVILLAISYLRLRSPNGYLLVVHYDEEAQVDIENTLKRSVRFYAFALVEADGEEFHNARTEQFRFLEQQGFDVVEHRLTCADTLDETLRYFEEKIKTFEIPSDGLVALYDDQAAVEEQLAANPPSGTEE